MTDPSARSSDLLLARDLARTLCVGAAAAPAPAAVTAAAYVRFPRRSERPAAPASAPEPAPEPAVPHSPFDSWERLLAHLHREARAEAAFVVDSQGFVIATWGPVPAEGFEAIGAELCFVMEQLQRVDPQAGGLLWVDLDFLKRKVLGFHATLQKAPPKTEEFVIGFVGAAPITGTQKQSMYRLIVDSLPGLT
jgi:hypothetical protein